ncbi:MAG: ABC-F family ATP-binding cassette domain-containing protein [Phycisphaerae bacterium]|nr:ABC-F family ATP-binding cassette domain-containing protein [Phycisphaerae bacterium]
MAIVTFHDVNKMFGTECVFDSLCLSFFEKEAVGMVGANGSGKSTILKLILGEIKPDVGHVVISKGLRLGYLPQEASFDGAKTVLEEMHAGVHHLFQLQARIHAVSKEMEALNGSALEARMKLYDQLNHEFELAGGYEYETRIEMTLKGLGFDKALFHSKTSALSGGQLSRLGLAKVLMLETDLLLLDEPTNHLDLQATEWLERFLSNYSGAVIMISHDRYLLDRVAKKIIEVENHGARVWKGNYTNYMATKDIVRLQQTRENEKRVDMVERTRDFIARNINQKGMKKTARGRQTRLDRLLKENPDYLELASEQKSIHFSFAKSEGRSDLVMRCEGLSKSFGDIHLFDGIDMEILNGERIGITGPNGTGKSTFIKLLLGQIEPTAGTLRLAGTLKAGYLDQHGEILDPDCTVLEEAQKACPSMTPEQVRSKLGAFLFSGDDVFKLVKELSGGQRNRLMLCRLVLGRPDILVLDEPTNHLDIASREMLEQALDTFNGTLLVVSHDRYFLDKVADSLMVVGTDELGQRCLGKTEMVHGKPAYTHYTNLIKTRREQDLQARDRVKTVKKAGDRELPKAKTPEELRRFNKYSVDQIEGMIMDLEEALVHLKERFGDEAVYKSTDKLAQLQAEFDDKTKELDLLYRAYERRSG